MQTLTFTNANGVEIDLTSGNYGITNWEGFSNTGLNIQTQQVPFQDGSVFLDALINDRELSVTLAIQDNNDLETRYELRRELISVLNPKLGEGVLTYTNNFLSKQIKCIPQIPLFENHNSNDSGTPKASLVFSACSPYWEDIDDTEVELETNTPIVINNQGDIPTQLEIEIQTGLAINPQIQNLTTDERIRLKGTFTENININTNLGQKSVTTKNLDFRYLSGADLESFAENDEFVLMGAGNIQIKIDENLNVTSTFLDTSMGFVMYVESLGKFYRYYNSMYESKDGETWTLLGTIGATIYSMAYADDLGLFVGVGTSGNIYYSNDGTTWTQATSGVSVRLYKIKYISDVSCFIAVGDSGTVLRSANGTSWTTVASGSGILYDLIYIKEGAKVYIVGSSGITEVTNVSSWTSSVISSQEGRAIAYNPSNKTFSLSTSSDLYYSEDCVTWTKVSYEENISCGASYLFYSKICDCILGNYDVGGGLVYTVDGLTWNKLLWLFSSDEYNYIECIKWVDYLDCYIVGDNDGYIWKSADGKVWEYCTRLQGRVVDIASSDNTVICVSIDSNYENIACSSDGENWTLRQIGHSLNDCAYSSDLGLFIVGEIYYGIIFFYTSSDGINWTTIDTRLLSDKVITGIDWSPTLELFCCIGVGFCLTSPDGTTWTERTIDNYTYESVKWISELGMFIASGNVGGNHTAGVITYSEDGINWTSVYIGVNEKIWNSAYDVEKGILVVGSGRNIVYSPDLQTWNSTDYNAGYNIYAIEYNSTDKQLLAVGQDNIVLEEITSEKKNYISTLSTDSNMNLNLKEGNNTIKLKVDGGTATATIKYRQKYIGV